MDPFDAVGAGAHLSQRKTTSFPTYPRPHFTPGKDVPHMRLASTVSRTALECEGAAIGAENATEY